MSGSRTKNAKRNIAVGLIREVVSMVLAFATRTMVLYVLGEQYLGLGGLFTAILNVLNLAELGFNVAVTFFLYKPIAENDTAQICAITAYLRKIYRIIGSVVLTAGLCVLPFLTKLIAGGYPNDINIYILYVIYLANTVSTYWFCAYKSILLSAAQRTDVVSKVYIATSFATKILQLLALVLLRNYYLFAVLLVLGTVSNNLLLHYISKKIMPEITPIGKISRELRSSIGRQMRAIFIGKLSDLSRNSCDSIFLSAWFGLAVVAVYDNYMYIYNALFSVVWTISGAIHASVGNSLVQEPLEKNKSNFVKFDFLFNWFVSWCTVCLFCLFQPFMRIWMKGNESLLLSEMNMILICLYFYLMGSCAMQNVYVGSAGLFLEIKNWYVVESVSNLFLNAVLGYYMGVTGIILATLISALVCNFAVRSGILFRSYFKLSPGMFYWKHAVYFAVMVCAGIVTAQVCSFVPNDGIPGFVLRMFICAVVPNLVFAALYWKDSSFRECIRMLREIIQVKE